MNFYRLDKDNENHEKRDSQKNVPRELALEGGQLPSRTFSKMAYRNRTPIIDFPDEEKIAQARLLCSHYVRP